MAGIEHGSDYAAYQQCKRKSPGGACPPCKAAHAAYKRQWRADRPLAAAVEYRLTRAQGRALWRLARMHPVMFRALVDEELSKGEQRREAA